MLPQPNYRGANAARLYTLEEYVSKPPSDELIASVEQELGYKLPSSYIWLMKQHNGGIPISA